MMNPKGKFLELAKLERIRGNAQGEDGCVEEAQQHFDDARFLEVAAELVGILDNISASRGIMARDLEAVYHALQNSVDPDPIA